MRVYAGEWTVASAVKVGHYHLYKGANCQDAADFFAADGIICGVGCDGCGEGEHSEVGARMLCLYALSEVSRLHQMGFPVNRIVDTLFSSLVRFVDMQVYMACPADKSPQAIAHYVKHHWLATVVGFIIQENLDGAIFSGGDGVYVLDDEYVSIDQNNVPKYISYHALREPETVGVTPGVLPGKFTVRPFDASKVSRIMIASDGFENHNEQKLELSRQRHPELTASLDGQQWGKKGQFGLKKWMNSRSDRGYFDDDCFVITAERTHAENDIR